MLALDYPELCARLVDAHRCFLETGTANREQAALQKMNSAFAMLERQGRTPTVRNLETACGSVLLPNGMLRKAFERTKKTTRPIN